MAYFTHMTTKTTDKSKKNIVLMCEQTWNSIPPKFKPMRDRINFVVSELPLNLGHYRNSYVFKNVKEVEKVLAYWESYERVWVIGGSAIFKVCTHFQIIFYHKC